MTSVESNETDHRPSTPSEDDCCGNSCNPCIFDIHQKLLKEWSDKKLNRLNIFLDKNYLLPIKFNKLIIVEIKKTSKDCILINLNSESRKEDGIVFLLPGQHVMIKLDETTKPYTPISWTHNSIKLLIKLYLNGKASNYFKKLQVRDELFLRGPYGEFRYSQNSHKYVIMFSIGSGIAAMYPIANSIVQDDLEDTRITMILGFRSFSHVPLKDNLRDLSDYWNFECTLYLSKDSDVNITGVNVVSNRLNGEIIQGILSTYSPELSLILICGTTEFNDSVEKVVKEKNYLHYHVFR